MSDFEKEMEIIRYLVENVDYDQSQARETRGIPYGALVEGTAVCQGYSMAFWQMADACGLEVVYVSGRAGGDAHGWNKIKLDGKWYNVDVTWEDPIINGSTQNGYGFDQTWNRYINATDEVIEWDHTPEMIRDMVWTGYQPGTENYKKYAATATKYDSAVVEYYLLTGDVDTSMRGDKWRKYMMANPEINDTLDSYAKLFYYEYRMDDGSNYFKELEETKVASYLQETIKAEGIQTYYLTTLTAEKPAWLTEEWVVQQIGGDLGKWTVTSKPEKSIKEDYLIYKLIYGGEYSDLRDTEAMRKLFESACAADKSNVVSTAVEAEAYVKKGWDAETEMAKKPKTITVIYKGMEAPASEDVLKNWSDYIKTSKETQDTVTVDGESYVICRYELTYNTLQEYLEGIIGKNFKQFAKDGADDLEYLKGLVDSVIEEKDSIDFWAVYPAGSGENWSNKLNQYAQEVEEGTVGIMAFTCEEIYGKQLSYEGIEYDAYMYRIDYYPQETKSLKKSINRDVLATPSNAQYSQ